MSRRLLKVAGDHKVVPELKWDSKSTAALTTTTATALGNTTHGKLGV